MIKLVEGAERQKTPNEIALSILLSGLTIIFTRPFRVGEYVSIAGVEGVVDEISIFSTVLRHLDRSDVVIPNRKIAGEILHNYGEIRQLNLSVNVAYGTDISAAVGSVRDVLESNPRVLQDPAPLVAAAALGETPEVGEVAGEAGGRQFRQLVGLGVGDRIALMLENHPRYFEICWAAQRSGLTFTALSTRLTDAEAAYIVDD